MRIENLRAERREGRRRVAAELRWEDSDRPDRELYFETSGELAAELEPSPDAFLLATLPLAVWHGERRLRVEGAVCPRLRDGLHGAMALFSLWYRRCRPLVIEAAHGFVPPLPRPGAGTASFMSGGVDALALLRANRLEYPLDHPGSIRVCLFLFGLNSHDFAGTEPRPERLAAHEAHRQRLEHLGERTDFTLVPVQTNVRTLYDDFASWADVGFGTGTIAAALAMPGLVRSVWFASGARGIDRPAHGSHARLDHLFSNAAVEVHHGQPTLTRLEKTRLVAEWEEARTVLRSCFYRELPPDGAINCERCEKCVRTMLALVVLGRLREVSAFRHDDVAPEMLEVVQIRSALDVIYYAEYLEPLTQRNRQDLRQVLEARITAYERRRRWSWVRPLLQR